MEGEPEQLEQTDGNTSSRRSDKARAWFFTYNIPSEEEVPHGTLEQLLSVIEPRLYVFQLEQAPTTSQLHYQGVLAVKNPVVMPKWLCAQVHWERCRDLKAAIRYCQKAETRLRGPWGFNVTMEQVLKLPSLQQFAPWQLHVLALIAKDPDYRTIHWFWDSAGNTGKSSLCRYIRATQTRSLYVAGAGKDIIYAMTKKLEKGHVSTVLFDIPRICEGHVSYSAMEQIKNGILFNGKYESGDMIFNPPHIICFSNFPPDEGSLSADRWSITNIATFGRPSEVKMILGHAHCYKP